MTAPDKPQGRKLTWQAHGGRAYHLYWLDDLKDSGSRTLLAAVTVNSRVGPWSLTSNNFVDTTAGGASGRAYYLVVEPRE